MTELNLIAKSIAQERILDYLQENVSEALADKINNGVYIEKDGKRLLNKKTLDGFMTYASDEAKKLADKGARSACVDDEVVYGWAIHYFEEDSIEGRLYNENGTEYQPAKQKSTASATASTAVPYTPSKPAPKPQLNIFDMLTSDKSDITEQTDNYEPLDLADELKPPISAPNQRTTPPAPTHPLNPVYEHYLNIQIQYPDSIVAYRLGDFYEVFGENAKLLADELNLTLTGRDFGLESRVPMIGFPFHAMDNYFSKIINSGHIIALAEDLDNIKVYEVNGETGEIISSETNDEELITVSKLIGETPVENETDEDDLLSVPIEDLESTDLEYERRNMKAFDIEAMLILQELLDNKITLV